MDEQTAYCQTCGAETPHRLYKESRARQCLHRNPPTHFLDYSDKYTGPAGLARWRRCQSAAPPPIAGGGPALGCQWLRNLKMRTGR